ncbi:hypothetical protein [Breznakiella homolactica]|uniref:Uncharacterized protein n=1 Tax=Breznakiella homolactica TaxID=2798577 RepID=A0A7T7XM49_9SPIR|nr:hypothetical protein [Breznakiella homolactica]QQO08752.1 hypothetical protein JFL75_17765 [Breznakiella homolactica]
MKKKSPCFLSVLAIFILACSSSPASPEEVALRFDTEGFTEKTVTFPDGASLRYRAYKNIFFVPNAEDRPYQYLNICTKLVNQGYSADYQPARNRGHRGDYNLDEAFAWLASIPGLSEKE